MKQLLNASERLPAKLKIKICKYLDRIDDEASRKTLKEIMKAGKPWSTWVSEAYWRKAYINDDNYSLQIYLKRDCSDKIKRSL